jgi:hypothetical protein
MDLLVNRALFLNYLWRRHRLRLIKSLIIRNIPSPSFPLAEERDVGRSDDTVSSRRVTLPRLL